MDNNDNTNPQTTTNTAVCAIGLVLGAVLAGTATGLLIYYFTQRGDDPGPSCDIRLRQLGVVCDDIVLHDWTRVKLNGIRLELTK